MPRTECDSCSSALKFYERTILVHPDKEQALCDKCMNAWASEVGKMDFQHPEFMPIKLVDASGIEHEFHFRAMLHATGLGIEAFELLNGDPGGYECSVLGDHEEDPMILFKKLYEKLKKNLARKHLEKDDRVETGWFVKGMTVRGQVGCDSPERLPMITIDGKEFTWRQFGAMALQFEGFQFRIEFVDRTEEV